MCRHLHGTAVVAALTVLWIQTPLVARAQTDYSQSPYGITATPDLAPGQIYVPASNPAQSVPGYTPAQFSTAQPSYGNGTYSANVGQSYYGYGILPLPPTTSTTSQPSYSGTQLPMNAMQPSYISRPSYVGLVTPPIMSNQPMKISYPSWATSVPINAVSGPSYMSVQKRGSFGQLPAHGLTPYNGYYLLPGSYSPSYLNGPSFMPPNGYNYYQR